MYINYWAIGTQSSTYTRELVEPFVHCRFFSTTPFSWCQNDKNVARKKWNHQTTSTIVINCMIRCTWNKYCFCWLCWVLKSERANAEESLNLCEQTYWCIICTPCLVFWHLQIYFSSQFFFVVVAVIVFSNVSTEQRVCINIEYA